MRLLTCKCLKKEQRCNEQQTSTCALLLTWDVFIFMKLSICSMLSSCRNRCISSPPEVGYSQQTLLARGSILKGALDTLLDPTTRKDYDERMMIGDIVESVPVDYVAGRPSRGQSTPSSSPREPAFAGFTLYGSSIYMQPSCFNQCKHYSRSHI